MFTVTKPCFTVFFLIIDNFINEVVEKCIRNLYVLCSMYIEGFHISQYELLHFGGFVL